MPMGRRRDEDNSMMKNNRLFLFVFVYLCLLAFSSCSVNKGFYLYFDNVTKHIYNDEAVQILFYPIDYKATGLYVHNNTDKILFVDKGTSFISTNGKSEVIYKASADLHGVSSIAANGSALLLPGGIVSMQTAGVGAFHGDMISEKRVIPIAPKSTELVAVFYVIDQLVRQGSFLKYSRHSLQLNAGNGKRKNLKVGMREVYNTDNTILKYDARIRYSFQEDMANYKDAVVDNYLKSWVIDKKEGVSQYASAELPFVNKYRSDTENYTIFYMCDFR